MFSAPDAFTPDVFELFDHVCVRSEDYKTCIREVASFAEGVASLSYDYATGLRKLVAKSQKNWTGEFKERAPHPQSFFGTFLALRKEVLILSDLNTKTGEIILTNVCHSLSKFLTDHEDMRKQLISDGKKQLKELSKELHKLSKTNEAIEKQLERLRAAQESYDQTKLLMNSPAERLATVHRAVVLQQSALDQVQAQGNADFASCRGTQDKYFKTLDALEFLQDSRVEKLRTCLRLMMKSVKDTCKESHKTCGNLKKQLGAMRRDILVQKFRERITETILQTDKRFEDYVRLTPNYRIAAKHSVAARPSSYRKKTERKSGEEDDVVDGWEQGSDSEVEAAAPINTNTNTNTTTTTDISISAPSPSNASTISDSQVSTNNNTSELQQKIELMQQQLLLQQEQIQMQQQQQQQMAASHMAKKQMFNADVMGEITKRLHVGEEQQPDAVPETQSTGPPDSAQINPEIAYLDTLIDSSKLSNVTAACLTKDQRSIDKLLDELATAASVPAVVMSQLYLNAALIANLQKSDTTATNAILNAMATRATEISSEALGQCDSYLLHCLVTAGTPQQGLDLANAAFSCLRRCGRHPNSKVYLTLIDAAFCADDGTKATRFIQEGDKGNVLSKQQLETLLQKVSKFTKPSLSLAISVLKKSIEKK